MADLGYESASVVFLISRVGTGKQAQKFVEELGNDPTVGSTVYVSKSDLALKRSVFKRIRDDNEYTAMVSRFTAQISTQLSNTPRYPLTMSTFFS
jgi:hypothetical protein